MVSDIYEGVMLECLEQLLYAGHWTHVNFISNLKCMEMVNRKIIKSNFQCVTFAVKGTHVLRQNGEYLK